MTNAVELLKRYRLIIAGVLAGLFFYVLDALLETLYFNPDDALLVNLFAPEPHNFAHRLIATVLMMVFGVMAHVLEHRGRLIERALKESRNHYLNLANATFDGILFNIDGRIVEVNDKVERLFGYTRQELLGRTTSFLTVEASRDFVRRMTEERSEEPYEVTGLRKDGSTFEMMVLSRNITYEGEPARISALRDVSHLKGYEKLERLKQESEDTLLRITSMFLSRRDVDSMMERALREFGIFSHADRIYISEVREGGAYLDNTYEWTAEGFESSMTGVEGIPFDEFYSEMESLRRSHVDGDLPEINPGLPPDERERVEYVRTGGDAYIDIPLYAGSRFVGVLSFEYSGDAATAQKRNVMVRQIFADIVEVMLEGKRAGGQEPPDG